MKTILVRLFSLLLAVTMVVTMAQDANARGMGGFKSGGYSAHGLSHFKSLRSFK